MSMLCGMMVGSAIAMLLTPKTGPEMRKKIKDMVDTGSDKIHDKLHEVKEKFEEGVCQCNN